MRDESRRRLSIHSRGRQAGFSLLEVLVGFGILLVILGALLPLFTRAVGQNLEGKESSDMSNLSSTQVEGILQLPFNNWQVQVTAGLDNTVVDYRTQGTQDHFGDETWVATVPSGEVAPWQRTTTIRQFGINGVRDTDLDGVIDVFLGLEDADLDGEFDNPLPAGTFPGAIHIRDVEVFMQGQRSNLGGALPSQMRLRALKAI